MKANQETKIEDSNIQSIQQNAQNREEEGDKKQGNDTDKARNICRLTVVIILISLSSFYFGFSLTYLQAISVKLLKRHYGQMISNSTTMPMLTGSMPIGAIFGSLLAEPGVRYFTRRNYLTYINIAALCINVIIQFTNIWVLLFCRIITGVLVGLYLAIVPIYIHQITPKSVSGIFGAFTQLQKLFGNVISYSLGLMFYLTKSQSQITMRFQLSFTTLLIVLQMIFIVTGFIPESPNSLLKINKIQQARSVLALFNHENKVDELIHQKIQQNDAQSLPHHHENLSIQIAQEERADLLVLPDQKQVQMTWKSYFLGFQLPFSHQLTGVNFLLTQLTVITVVYDEKLSHYTALIANLVQLVVTIFSASLIDRLGRRTLILIGNLLIAILNIGIGLAFLALDRYGWLPGFSLSMILIMIFNVVFGLTLGPIVWLYVPEIVTQKVVPLATATYWCGCSICVILAPIIATQMDSPFAVFLFLGIYLLVVFVVNYFLVVETKGLTAVQISQKFKEL